MFLIYLMIVTGAHLEILAMRLTRLGESKIEPTDGIMAIRRENDLINSIDIYNNILKFQFLYFVYVRVFLNLEFS